LPSVKQACFDRRIWRTVMPTIILCDNVLDCNPACRKTVVHARLRAVIMVGRNAWGTFGGRKQRTDDSKGCFDSERSREHGCSDPERSRHGGCHVKW
jgi:hypothetical protein